MKVLIFSILILIFLSFNIAYSEKGTFVDSVKFIQYLDENTALEEIRNGNLDLYYYRIASDRIDNPDTQKGLKIYDSTGGSYSLLINPAESEKFNPFSIRDVRFALNYLVDRKLIVNELMGGYGTIMYSNYGTFDADYVTIVKELESFHFRYNPILAEEMISTALEKKGAIKQNGVWMFEDQPIEITVFIRSDDPVRKSIGEILSSELEKMGFKVKKDFGDLNKAFVVVYGSNPSELKWNVYTEGWGGRSAFVRYDSVGLGQMYAPWFSSMPGFNNPDYWNYKDDYLDSLTQKIYTGNFSSSDERNELIKKATREGINESVRVFLASKIDQYVTNNRTSGIVNDFGAGVPSRFTPINARTSSDNLIIGVKQIYQGSWNPVGGFSDMYSRSIWDEISDPGTFKHPYNGKTIPVRTTWKVETAGPNGVLDVPDDVKTWDVKTNSWKNVSKNSTATSKVTIDFKFSNWHHGKKMDLNDIIYSLGFLLDWGSEQTENDMTYDSEFSPKGLQFVKTLVGIKKIDDDTIEVYVNYWHFDEGEIADWATVWTSTPWEVFAAMEEAVKDGKVSFSRSGAVDKNVNWISQIIPNDAKLIESYLKEFKDSEYVPTYLKDEKISSEYITERYESAISWIESKNHAVISNGPFYLQSYSPESRTIIIKSFDDDTYPFAKGYWSEFENIEFPQITNVSYLDNIKRGDPVDITINHKNTAEIQYFITSSDGQIIDSNTIQSDNNPITIHLSQDTTKKMLLGSNELKIFANSYSVLRPDIFTTSFLVTDSTEIPTSKINSEIKLNTSQEFLEIGVILGIILVMSPIIIWKIKNKKKLNA